MLFPEHENSTYICPRNDIGSDIGSVNPKAECIEDIKVSEYETKSGGFKCWIFQVITCLDEQKL